MLSDWVKGFASGPRAKTAGVVADWLQTKATPDDWHRGVSGELNWTWGIAPFLWIIRQQRCEKATALMAFYLARPGQMLDYGNERSKVPGWEREAFDLVSEIRQRFLSGFYTRASIAFDADHAVKAEAHLPGNAAQEAIDAVIPEIMRRSIPGRTSKNEWDVEPEVLLG